MPGEACEHECVGLVPAVRCAPFMCSLHSTGARARACTLTHCCGRLSPCLCHATVVSSTRRASRWITWTLAAARPCLAARQAEQGALAGGGQRPQAWPGSPGVCRPRVKVQTRPSLYRAFVYIQNGAVLACVCPQCAGSNPAVVVQGLSCTYRMVQSLPAFASALSFLRLPSVDAGRSELPFCTALRVCITHVLLWITVMFIQSLLQGLDPAAAPACWRRDRRADVRHKRED